MRLGQLSMEFIILLGMLIVMMLAFLLIISELSRDKMEEKAMDVLKDLGISVQNEIILASNVREGYTRTVIIPDRIEGVPINITSETSWLYTEYHGKIQIFRIPNITGEPFSGPGTYRISLVEGGNGLVAVDKQ